MNGAMAVPSVKTIRVPNKSKKKTIGASQNFLRTFKNSKNSTNIDNLDINISFTLIYIKIVFHNLDSIQIQGYDDSNKKLYLTPLILKNPCQKSSL